MRKKKSLTLVQVERKIRRHGTPPRIAGLYIPPNGTKCKAIAFKYLKRNFGKRVENNLI